MPELMIAELQKMIVQQNWQKLKSKLKHTPAADIGEILLLVEEQERALLFRVLSREKAAEIFSILEPDEQDSLLEILSNHETRQLLAALTPDDRTALLSEMPSHITRRLMGLLSHDDLQESRILLGYPEESVGRLMTPDYIKIRSEWSVERALQHIRKFGNDSETINLLYIIDDAGVLVDSLRLRTLILANLEDNILDLMNYNSISLSAFSDREEAVTLMQKYDVMALPVVDSANELIGIVTFDDVMDVAEEEATEDMQRSVSVSPLKIAYDKASIRSLYSKRVGWLIVLVVLNILTATVISLFEEQLSKLAILVSFVPLLIGTGGNVGAQASTLVIRALVTGELELDQLVETIMKELLVGLCLGVTLGMVAAIIGFFRAGTVGNGLFDIPLVVFLSMVAIVMSGNMIGMFFPFLLSKLKIDPAVASGPLITTLTDAIGLLIYFNIAIMILNI